MVNTTFLFLALSLILHFSACRGLSAAYSDQGGAGATASPSAQDESKASTQIKMWLRDLRSQDEIERAKAKKALLAFSDISPENRQMVVGELLEIAKTPRGSAEFLIDAERFLQWQEATDILGTMRATEAIDLLVQCLNCNDGRAGLSPVRYPATRAIIKIGAEAVPKLSEALERQSLGVRFMSVQALYAIGGDKAKEALEQALRKEKDKRIAQEITDSLLNWDNSGRNKP